MVVVVADYVVVFVSVVLVACVVVVVIIDPRNIIHPNIQIQIFYEVE